MDMGSAPRDGTKVLLFWSHIGFWTAGYFGSRGHAKDRWMGYLGAGQSAAGPVINPIAWMPMPPKPSSPSDSNGGGE